MVDIDELIVNTTTQKEEEVKSEEIDLSNKEQKKKRGNPNWKKGVSANPEGRPEGSISLLGEIKRRLTLLSKENPEEFKELIEYYWKEPKMRDLLIRMIDGNPKQSSEVDVNLKNYEWGNYKDNNL